MKIFGHKKNSDNCSPDQCLSDLQLASLLEGHLKAKEKRSYIRHINRCNDCRFCWMEASSFIVSPTPSQSKKLSLRRWFKPFNIFPTSIKVVSGLAVITILLVVTMIQQPNQPNINTMLNQQYVLLNHESSAIDNKQPIDFPWEHGVFGFSSTSANQSSLAFATGLWDGRAALSELNITSRSVTSLQTQENEYKIHYQLGRWLTSLWYTSQLNIDFNRSEPFKILEIFSHELQSKTTSLHLNKVHKSIIRLNDILKDFEQKNITHDQFREQLEIIIAILSPVSLN